MRRTGDKMSSTCDSATEVNSSSGRIWACWAVSFPEFSLYIHASFSQCLPTPLRCAMVGLKIRTAWWVLRRAPFGMSTGCCMTTNLTINFIYWKKKIRTTHPRGHNRPWCIQYIQELKKKKTKKKTTNLGVDFESKRLSSCCLHILT